MTVKKITSIDCQPLRHQVLWPHILLEKNCTIDIDNRQDALHFGVFNDEKIISICSFFRTSNSDFEHFKTPYQLRAMATAAEFRGKNVGKLLILKAKEILKEEGADLIWCNARKIALGFYSKLGFSIQGDYFEIENIGPHKKMYLEL